MMRQCRKIRDWHCLARARFLRSSIQRVTSLRAPAWSCCRLRGPSARTRCPIAEICIISARSGVAAYSWIASVASVCLVLERSRQPTDATARPDTRVSAHYAPKGKLRDVRARPGGRVWRPARAGPRWSTGGLRVRWLAPLPPSRVGCSSRGMRPTRRNSHARDRVREPHSGRRGGARRGSRSFLPSGSILPVREGPWLRPIGSRFASPELWKAPHAGRLPHAMRPRRSPVGATIRRHASGDRAGHGSCPEAVAFSQQ